MRSDLVLRGRHAELRPLTEADLDGLAEVGLDASIWRWMPEPVRSRDELLNWIQSAIADREAGIAMPFTVRSASDGRIAGTTRFGNIMLAHGRVEIGWTWYGASFQRTGINTECKLLLFGHAFEVLGCTRVELKTDRRNARSRAAILRIGAKEEGTLRKHMPCADGTIRDTVYYSVLDDEWPDVKRALAARLERG